MYERRMFSSEFGMLYIQCFLCPPTLKLRRTHGSNARGARIRAMCRGRDSNPHSLRHVPLKHACLPFHHPGDAYFVSVGALSDGVEGAICSVVCAAGAVSITDCVGDLFANCASQIEVTRNDIATTAVNLLKNVVAPLPPNTVCEAPPKAAPISAPFPACNRMTIIKNRQIK